MVSGAKFAKSGYNKNTSGCKPGGRLTHTLGGVDSLWAMRPMKENEREVPNGTEAL